MKTRIKQSNNINTNETSLRDVIETKFMRMVIDVYECMKLVTSIDYVKYENDEVVDVEALERLHRQIIYLIRQLSVLRELL